MTRNRAKKNSKKRREKIKGKNIDKEKSTIPYQPFFQKSPLLDKFAHACLGFLVLCQGWQRPLIVLRHAHVAKGQEPDGCMASQLGSAWRLNVEMEEDGLSWMREINKDRPLYGDVL